MTSPGVGASAKERVGRRGSRPQRWARRGVQDDMGLGSRQCFMGVEGVGAGAEFLPVANVPGRSSVFGNRDRAEPERAQARARVGVQSPRVPREFSRSVFERRKAREPGGARRGRGWPGLSGPIHKYAHVRCAQFGLGQGARSEQILRWICERRATPPQAKFGATQRAAVLFRPDFVARDSQIHFGICSSLAPRLAEKFLAANESVFMKRTTEAAGWYQPKQRTRQ